jgi:hypothetical protein
VNPLVLDAASGAGLSGSEQARMNANCEMNNYLLLAKTRSLRPLSVSLWLNEYYYRIVDAPKIVRVRLKGSLLKMPPPERN